MGSTNKDGVNSSNDNQTGKYFFVIPPELQAKFEKDAPELLAIMKESGEKWQTSYSAKRDEEIKAGQELIKKLESAESKAGVLDGLMSENEFTTFLYERNMRKKGTLVNNEPIKGAVSDDAFSKYEGGDELRQLFDQRDEKLLGKIMGQLKPMMDTMVVDREDQAINAFTASLESRRANGENLPNIDNSVIKINMRNHNLDVEKAYNLAATPYLLSGSDQSLMDNFMNQSNDQNRGNEQNQSNDKNQGNEQNQNNDQNQSNDQNKNSANAMVNTGRTGASLLLHSNTGTSIDDKLKAAKEIEGQVIPMADHIKMAIDSVNEEFDTNISYDEVVK